MLMQEQMVHRPSPLLWSIVYFISVLLLPA